MAASSIMNNFTTSNVSYHLRAHCLSRAVRTWCLLEEVAFYHLTCHIHGGYTLHPHPSYVPSYTFISHTTNTHASTHSSAIHIQYPPMSAKHHQLQLFTSHSCPRVTYSIVGIQIRLWMIFNILCRFETGRIASY